MAAAQRADGKQEVYEGGNRVPTYAVWPEQIDPGTRSDAMAMTMDLLPTICNVAGVSANNLENDPQEQQDLSSSNRKAFIGSPEPSTPTSNAAAASPGKNEERSGALFHKKEFDITSAFPILWGHNQKIA